MTLMVGTDSKRNTPPVVPAAAAIAERSRRAIARLAECESPVLLVGERGVGKRSIALELHTQSRKTRGTFREYSCRDLDSQTVLALSKQSGTAYLVDLPDLSLSLQGLFINSYFNSDQTQRSRIIFASDHDLLEEVKSMRMREDFYYLASAVTLRIPPLRCRKTEILSLSDSLLSQYAKQFDRPKPVLSKEIIGFLMEHNWPENLPELETAIKTFVAIGDQTISLAALKAATPNGRCNGNHRNVSLKEATRNASIEIERQLISEVLTSTGGNRKATADKLGISYKALLYKIKQFGLDQHSSANKYGVSL